MSVSNGRHERAGWRSLLGLLLLAAFACGAGAGELNTHPNGNVPNTGYVTGPICGIARLDNDDLHANFWNQPELMAFSLGKSDVWDRRYFGDRKRLITLDDVRRICAEGDPARMRRGNDLGIRDSAQSLYHAYDFPCPKPVGQVLLRCPALAGAETFTAAAEGPNVLLVRAARGRSALQFRAFLHQARNVFVLRGTASNLPQPLQIQFCRHRDSLPHHTTVPALADPNRAADYDYDSDPDNGPLEPPQAGADGKFFWIRQRFPAEKTFPNGFEYVLMGLIEGPPCTLATADGVSDAGAKSIIHPVPQEDYKRLPGHLQEERKAAELVNAAPGSLATATLETGNASDFTLYVAVVTTRDAADPLVAARTELESARKAGGDALLAQHRAVTVEERRTWRNTRVLRYNATHPTYADATPWHGDYHFNEGYYLPQIIASQAADLEPRLRLIEEMLPAAQRNAREVYACRGACYPLVHYPIRHDRLVYANVTWELGIENTAFTMQPFWQIFQYTQDTDFLRQRAYPMLVEGARFYADYVKKGDDGCCHVIPTVSQEHWGLTKDFQLNRDSVGALSFIKYHLKACIEASELLGLDAPEREQWRDIVAHLAPYPTFQTPSGPVFCDVRDAPRLLNYNNTANLVMTLWAEDIGLDSPPDQLGMARRSLEAIPDQEHSYRPGYLNQIRLYLGVLKKPYPGPLGDLLSWTGRIHLFPGALPDVPQDRAFDRLLAVGGFEVSAVRAGTTVKNVRIRSLAGRACHVKNAFPSAQLAVWDSDASAAVPHRMKGDTIVFATRAGGNYRLLSEAEAERARRFHAQEIVIARWSFDQAKEGIVSDESGNGHHATLADGATIVSTDGRGALQVDGKAAHARVTRAAPFNFAANESFSVEARVKLDTVGANDMSPLVVSMDSKQYVLAVNAAGQAYLYLSSPTGDINCVARGATNVADGQWHRVRGVRDVADGTVKVYVDGRLDGVAADRTTGDFSTPQPLTLGAYFYGPRRFFCKGLIGDVVVKSLGKLRNER